MARGKRGPVPDELLKKGAREKLESEMTEIRTEQ